jgi:CRISPR-associated Cas5-like protein
MDECDSEHGYRKPGVQDDDTGHDVSSGKPQLWGTTATNGELWRVRDARFRARGPHHQAVGRPSSFAGIARSTRLPGPSTAVYSVRIPVERIEELRQLAAERDVQPTALIRTWVLAQLDAARSPEDYAQR